MLRHNGHQNHYSHWNYKHQIITAIQFIPAIKAITSIASIEATYNKYLDNVLSKSAELYKAAEQVYSIQWKNW